MSWLTCDRCRLTVETGDPLADEFVTIVHRGGRESLFGEGATIEIDLCQSCLKGALGPWLRVTPIAR